MVERCITTPARTVSGKDRAATTCNARPAGRGSCRCRRRRRWFHWTIRRPSSCRMWCGCRSSRSKGNRLRGAGRNVGLINGGMWVMPKELPGVLGSTYGERLLDLLGNAPLLVRELVEKHAIPCEIEKTARCIAPSGKRGSPKSASAANNGLQEARPSAFSMPRRQRDAPAARPIPVRFWIHAPARSSRSLMFEALPPPPGKRVHVCTPKAPW